MLRVWLHVLPGEVLTFKAEQKGGRLFLALGAVGPQGSQ